MTIHIEEATIKTLSVQIQAMTVGAKQMTLAVYRQIDVERLLSPLGEICGTLWGRVNYHTPQCKIYGEHIDVVFQVGTKLCREAIPYNMAAYRWLLADKDSAAAKAEWQRVYRVLQRLPLLFIAV